MKVVVMLADGFEEIEALTVVDVLRRGFVDTVMVSVKNDRTVTSARSIPVIADKTIREIRVEQEDIIVLPGGSKGVKGLEATHALIELLQEHQSHKGLLAAICAGPTIPGKLGFYKNTKATCYPGCEADLKGAQISREDVVIDRNFVTSRGPGTSLAFAFTLLALIRGEEATDKLKTDMLFK